jgi:hypothetical protein
MTSLYEMRYKRFRGHERSNTALYIIGAPAAIHKAL